MRPVLSEDACGGRAYSLLSRAALAQAALQARPEAQGGPNAGHGAGGWGWLRTGAARARRRLQQAEYSSRQVA